MADDKSKQHVENPNLEKGKDLGGEEVQAKMDEEVEQGFRGANVDPTPDANYTVAGVTANKPTPETDEKMAQKAVATLDTGVGRFRGANVEPSKPAKMVKLKSADGREIEVSEKLRHNYPDYKEVK